MAGAVSSCLRSRGLWHNFGDTAHIDTQRTMLRTAFDLGITDSDLANNDGSTDQRPQDAVPSRSGGRPWTLLVRRFAMVLSSGSGLRVK